MALLLTVLLTALVFEYINGFHDTANSIAAVVSTKVLTPRNAIILAVSMDLWGALSGVAVAKTISTGLVDSTFVDSQTIIAALLGAIVWNLTTWYFGLPSSSSHALVGGLCGATLATAHNHLSALIWYKMVPGKPFWNQDGILPKVIFPMIASPILGFVGGFILMSLLYLVVRHWRVTTVSRTFGTVQIFSAGFLGRSHGLNDAQKTMGIIALALYEATAKGSLDHAPSWLHFLKQGTPDVPLWVKITCAVVMASGTAGGGWRIIRTMGHRMVRLQPIHGFAAETTAGTILSVAGSRLLGMPVSTTHVVTASIMGVGCAKRFSALNLPVINRILWAWVLTIPAAGSVSYLAAVIARWLA